MLLNVALVAPRFVSFALLLPYAKLLLTGTFPLIRRGFVLYILGFRHRGFSYLVKYICVHILTHSHTYTTKYRLTKKMQTEENLMA